MHYTLRSAPLVATLLALSACGDDGSSSTSDPTTGGSLTTGNIPATPATVTDPATSDEPTTTVASTPSTSGATDVVTSTTEPATSSSSTTDEPETSSTGPVSASSSSDTGQTSLPCVCEPGEVSPDCEGEDLLVCAADCAGFEPAPCDPGEKCSGGICTAQFCVPNQVVCEGEGATKTCNAQGEAFDPPVNCADTEGCTGGVCTSLCLIAEAEPSTIGCSFIASRVDNIFGNEIDSLVLGNTSKTKNASVQLYFTPNGTNVEQTQGAPVIIQPGKTQIFQMTNPPFDNVSGVRKGGNYRVQSTIPIIAYQHSPITGQATNDASVLFPEHALKQDYVVSSFPPSVGDYPSYLNVIALADGTTVKWTPPVATNAGNGVAAVAANATGQLVMNRFDTLQVRAQGSGDVSGTFVTADKPIWVLGGSVCINVPQGVTYCDHIQEQMLALDYWGKKYVGAHSPPRNDEKHYWRVFGGEDGTVVTTTPAQPGTPIMVNKGQWKQIVIPNDVSFIFESDKPFLPVQYLEGQSGGGGTGDPAMYQMIPVEQFLDRYAFVTGQGYDVHYAQIIRLKGGPDVKVDGAIVNGYYTVGDYEVADYVISEGAHLAESDAPFGIINVGYTDATSYAYPGGLKLAVINPQ